MSGTPAGDPERLYDAIISVFDEALLRVKSSDQFTYPAESYGTIEVVNNKSREADGTGNSARFIVRTK